MALMLGGVRIFGLTPFAVLSGSMEPTFHVGSLIYVEKIAPESIKVGDPITFVLNKDLVVATHRVVEIDPQAQEFHTKGDANDAVDGGPVNFKNLIGKPVFTIPYMGYAADFLASRKGMILGGTGIAVLLILVFIPDILKLADKADSKGKGKPGKKDAKHPEV